MGRAGLEDLLPLSPLQEGLLFHALYDGTNGDRGPDVYAVQLVVALAGPVDPAAFRAAGEALLGRHANLRAGFRLGRSGRPAQLLPRAVELPWREVDVSDLDPDERAARARRPHRRRARAPLRPRPPARAAARARPPWRG